MFRTDRDYLNSHTNHAVLFTVSNLLQRVMRRNDLETTYECVWIEIPVIDNLNLLIGNHYFLPYFNVTIIYNYLKFWEHNLNTFQHRIIMLGDFILRNYENINGASLPNSYLYNKIKGNYFLGLD